MEDRVKVKMQTLRSIQVSVSVVFYNPTLDDLQRIKCNIEKLISLTDYQFKFYLIDNGSPERHINSDIFHDVQNVTSIIELKNNQGFGKGHNAVLTKLNSDYHIIMNPDINIDDLTGLRDAINYLEDHSTVVLLSPLVRDLKTGQIQYLNRKLPTVFDLFIRFLGPNFFAKRQHQFTKRQNGYDHIQPIKNATGSFMLLRTKAFKQVHGFDPRFFMYFEDTDLTVRLAKIGQTIFYPSLTVYHGWKRDNHSFNGVLPMVRSMIKYFNKWGWRWY